MELPGPYLRFSEFEIQAFIYYELKKLEIVVRGEMPSYCGDCIFDLIIYKDSVPIRIIEVKKHLFSGAQKKTKSQVNRYSKFGVPVDIICSMDEAEEYIKNFQNLS